MDNKPKFTFFKLIKILILCVFMALALFMGSLGGVTVQIAQTTPEVNMQSINTLLNENSVILDQDGNVLEKIQTEEYRTVIPFSEMPEHVRNAFISVEDERFYTHFGVDLQGIAASMVDNLRAGGIVRGASTITQQLARNLYLTGDKNIERKIREAYLAMQLNHNLSKDQVLEAYLNRVYMGQGAYGIEAAADTYFSKSAKDLTLAEAAALAATVKSPTNYALYLLYRPEQVGDEQVVGEVDEYGDKYIAVYNKEPEKRKEYVLSKMLELKMINETQYQEAMAEDIASNLKPSRKRIDNLSTYYTDLVKKQVFQKLMSEKGLSEEDARHLLYKGGLRITAAVDVNMQRQLEDVFNNFTSYLLGDISTNAIPGFIRWKVDGAKNIIDQDGEIIFYKKENLFDEENSLIIPAGSFIEENGNLTIQVPYFKLYDNGSSDLADYYTINGNNNLVTHSVSGLLVDADKMLNTNKGVQIARDFIEKNKDFYSVAEDGSAKISSKYFNWDKNGAVQPQSAAVVIDHKQGQIKAIIGGREQEGFQILNRADYPRQPGSTMKPIATFIPALDNGFTAATPVDDVPFYNNKGEIWPNNWYGNYRGIMPVREILMVSGNVPTVKTLNTIGIDTSMKYLRRFHIIEEDPSMDTFVEKSEDPAINDENLASLGLGALTNGISPLRMTAAYSAIANDGVYKEPLTFTKVIDSNGEVLLDNPQKTDVVVSPQVAYVMNDILQSVAKDGTIGLAKLGDMDIAGKTGTTDDTADVWFIGFTPYYTCGVWIGNDNAKINLVEKSNLTAISLWRTVMEKAHQGLEVKKFVEPTGMVHAQVDLMSGKKPSAISYRDPRGTVRNEIFVAGTEPKEIDDVHVEVEIDRDLKKLASEFTPEILKEKAVYVKFPETYDPSKNKGIVPTDWSYRNIPTETAKAEDYELYKLLKERDFLDSMIGKYDQATIERFYELLYGKKPGEILKPDEKPSTHRP